MKNETTAINFDQEADMLYPTLNKVEELLKEYQMVPVFYEVLADYMTPIRMFQALRKEGTPCFMLESVENKDQWGRYSFIGLNPKSEDQDFRKRIRSRWSKAGRRIQDELSK